MNGVPPRFVLRDLPVAARLVIAAFLISVGLGYFSALVQLHFQNATPGKALPDPEDAAVAYHGRPRMSQMERLLVADESKPFNGTGTMAPAFTGRSARWPKKVEERAAEKKLVTKDGKPDLYQAEHDLRSERNGERLALVHWIRTGAAQKDYDEDSFELPAALQKQPVTDEYLVKDVKDNPTTPRRVKIKTVFEVRCARCHEEGKGGAAGQFPLDTYERVKDYCEVETTGGGMSLKKLAQSTHVHLLGFSMLYGLTGLIFAFTSYPAWMRVLLGPFTLVAQVVDIACWWLGRIDPLYAKAIVFTGGAVGTGLLLQIVLSLFNMFGKTGKVVLLLLIALALVGGYLLDRQVIAPYLTWEGLSSNAAE